jgi:hypothetical protein
MKVSPFVFVLLGLAACAPPAETPADAAVSVAPIIPSASTSVAAEAIPEAFIGLWDASMAACADGSELKLTVTPARLQFYESGGSVETVSIAGPADITVGMLMSGEGETWQRSLRMVLSEDGKSLTIDGGIGGVRIRCP